MPVKLLVKGEYRSNVRDLRPGDTLETDAETATWLMNDSPGNFEIVEVEGEVPEAMEEKEMEAPPADKMIGSGSRSYDDMEFKDLRELAKQRAIPAGGSRADIIKRLKRSDNV